MTTLPPTNALQELGPVEAEQQLNRVRFQRALNRRNFLQGLGIAGLATASAALVTGCSSSGMSTPVMASGVSETDVLNFALNLEYLEASFYLYATTGSGLSSTDMGTGTGLGTVTGGAQTAFTTPQIEDIAKAIASDEMLHVQALRSVLGSSAVPMPSINLAALGSIMGTQSGFLNLARAFEDVGVSAYAGAATLLTASNLQYAAQILAVEAYHSGNLRLTCIQQTPNPATTSVDSTDVLPTDPNFFFEGTGSGAGFAPTRTPSQVLQIVYANTASGTSKGGFFPNGLNGNITAVS